MTSVRRAVAIARVAWETIGITPTFLMVVVAMPQAPDLGPHTTRYVVQQ